MKDPERLLSATSDADELERDLLASLRGSPPPEGAKAEAWRRMAVQVAAATVVGGATESAAAAKGGAAGAALVKASATKLAWMLAASVVVVGAGAAALRLRTPLPPATNVAVVREGVPEPATTTTATTASTAIEAPAIEPAATGPTPRAVAPPSRVASPARPSGESGRDHLGDESALLARARAELRGGDARGAQATLARMRTEFPRGVLWQEREVLSIQALAAEGNSNLARQRARAFLAAHPESPHDPGLERLLAGP